MILSKTKQGKRKMTQEVINALKVRVFDAEEALKAERAQVNEFFQKLVDASKVKGDEQGNVNIDAILERVTKLVAMEEGSETAEFEEITQ